MLIEPTQPLLMTIKIKEQSYGCQLLRLSEQLLEIKSREFFETESQVCFLAQYFRGQARVENYSFNKPYFFYQLHIENIQFLPGLLINTRL